MAESLISVLEELQQRIKDLTGENGELRRRADALELENSDLRRQIAEADSARDKALLDCEYLAMSHRLADNPDTLADTRRHISRLIRNIDRCLAMLKE